MPNAVLHFYAWPLEQLCTDLNLPVPFECAIVFSICEQVTAYRRALYAHRWIGNDPTRGKLASRTATAASGYIDVMPPVDDVIRDEEDASTCFCRYIVIFEEYVRVLTLDVVKFL